MVSTSGSATSSFKYDPLGRLFETTINGTKTQFLYDGDALIAEYDGTGTLQRRYVHGDQVDEPWGQYNGSTVSANNRRYLYANHQGSIIAHSNNTGAVNTLAYDSFGIPATTNIDRFGYTGQIWLKELGLFHYKARMYHPKLGRFLQTDPIFYADQMNMYAYVGNDPVNKIDPSGTTCTMNDGKASCKVDDPGKLKPKEVARIEKAYTKAVNNLLKDPNKTSKITVKDKSFTVNPVGFAPDKPDYFNRYAYLGNDPVNKIDPSGMAQCAKSLSSEKCEQALIRLSTV